MGRDAGKWFWETDSADGGNSFIEWPVELGDGLSDDALDPVVVSFSRLYGIAKLEYALPAVSLPKSHFGVVECVSWDDFDMPDWARDNEYKITGEEAAKHVVRIVFRIRNQPGSYDFNIYAVGTNLN